jgi:hypothetical protein
MSDASNSIPKFAKLLQKEWQDLDGENLADIFWLARQISPSQIAEPSQSTPQSKDDVSNRNSDQIIAPPPAPQPKVPIVLPPTSETKSPQGFSSALPLKVPAANALRSRLALSRALRPLMQKILSRTQRVLDDEATAIQAVEQDIWSPVLTPAPERWFDLAIVIEDSPSLEIWTDTITELIELVEQQGAFRQIRTWRLTPELSLSPNWQATTDRRSRHPNALKVPHGRQIIWVLSDCTSDLWQQTQIHEILKDWGKYSPLVLVQLLPERLWQRTWLGDGRLMRMPAKYAGATQARLSEYAKPIYPMLADPDRLNPTTQTLILPTISIEPEPFRRWAKVTTGNINASIVGIEIDLARLSTPQEPLQYSESELPITPEEQIKERVKDFCGTASITAQRLAAYMAAVPVSIPIVHLIQKTLLPESQQIHVAEVFMGGIMEIIPLLPQSLPQRPQYRFIEGIREVLIAEVPISKTIRVLDTVSAYISERMGKGMKSFQALISLLHELNPEEREEVERFAEIGLDTLAQLGSEHRAMAERLRQYIEYNRNYKIRVWTPEGDPIDLPVDSTPVDFAYKIHTDVGNHCTATIVNNKIAPLNIQLQDGDTVYIIKGLEASPSLDWLKFVKTKTAVTQINSWHRNSLFNQGQFLLGGYLGRSIQRSENLANLIAKKLGFNNLNYLYRSIALDETSYKTIQLVLDEIDKSTINRQLLNISSQNVPIVATNQTALHMASCCQPTPNDSICGVVSHHNSSIILHRTDCKSLDLVNIQLILPMNWTFNRCRLFLEIKMLDKAGLAQKILNTLVEHNIKHNLREVKTYADNSTALAHLWVSTKTSEEFIFVSQKLVETLSGLLNVRILRIMTDAD